MLEQFAFAPASLPLFTRKVLNHVVPACDEATRAVEQDNGSHRKRLAEQQLVDEHDGKRRRFRTPSPTPSEDYWVFGYGSLIWKPPPHYEQNVTGYIKGYVRRFWQHSTDHRGTAEKPGRVVTLIPIDEWKSIEDYHHQSEDDVTWGVAYKIPADCAEDVRRNLDTRESGYAVRRIDIYQNGSDEPVVKQAFVYIATTCNSDYCGPADLECISRQICECSGQSGPNTDYLLNLAIALREIAPGCDDNHLFQLEQKVLTILESKKCIKNVSQAGDNNSKVLLQNDVDDASTSTEQKSDSDSPWSLNDEDVEVDKVRVSQQTKA